MAVCEDFHADPLCFFLTRFPEDRAPFSAEATDAELLRGTKSFNAGGGTYELAGADYIEHIQYCSYPNYEAYRLPLNSHLSMGC